MIVVVPLFLVSKNLFILSTGTKLVRPWNGKLGSADFTLACLLEFPNSLEGLDVLDSISLPDLSKLNQLVHNFCSSFSSSFTVTEHNTSNLILELASLLLRHGQYVAAEVFSFQSILF